MKATTRLPGNYRRQATLDLSKSKAAVAGAVVLGVVLLLSVAWMLVQLTRLLRPAALESLAFRNILTTTSEGGLSFALPLVDIAVALVLTTLVHELVHGLFYRWFSGRRPTFGAKGLFVYAAAPQDVYFPRNHFVIIGMAPLVLLTIGGLLLMLIVPMGAVSILGLVIAFNAAGAAGDLVMAARLLSYGPDTLIQDRETGVVVYGPDGSGSRH
jgi:hypothetical protein